MNRSIAGGLACLALMAGPVAAQTGTPPLRAELAPLQFLAGACWRGEFPGGAAFDVHCFEPVYGGHYLRDVHAVPGETTTYRGETLYHWDEAEQLIRYRYYNSIGGVSDGTARLDGDTLRFPDEVYRSEAGSEQVISSSLQQDGADAYLAASEDVTGDPPVDLFRMRFHRISREEAEALIEGGL